MGCVVKNEFKKLGVCLVLVFKNYFLFLKTKNTKNLFEKGNMFLFFVFSVFSKTTFFIRLKICFQCFFTVQIIDYFFVFENKNYFLKFSSQTQFVFFLKHKKLFLKTVFENSFKK